MIRSSVFKQCLNTCMQKRVGYLTKTGNKHFSLATMYNIFKSKSAATYRSLQFRPNENCLKVGPKGWMMVYGKCLIGSAKILTVIRPKTRTFIYLMLSVWQAYFFTILLHSCVPYMFMTIDNACKIQTDCKVLLNKACFSQIGFV